MRFLREINYYGLAEVEGELAVILDINAIVRDVFGHGAGGEET